jgi:hypothetical protein
MTDCHTDRVGRGKGRGRAKGGIVEGKGGLRDR